METSSSPRVITRILKLHPKPCHVSPSSQRTASSSSPLENWDQGRENSEGLTTLLWMPRDDSLLPTGATCASRSLIKTETTSASGNNSVAQVASTSATT